MPGQAGKNKTPVILVTGVLFLLGPGIYQA